MQVLTAQSLRKAEDKDNLDNSDYCNCSCEMKRT